MKLAYYRFLLRFRWRHKQLGCARYLGMSNMGEPMWNCRLHNRDAL